MSEPKPFWMNDPLASGEAAVPKAQAGRPFWEADPLANADTKPRWSGGVLPVSESADGKLQFDSNAGIVGGIKRALTTPGEVASGKLDLSTDEGFGRALELSGFASPLPPAVRASRLGVAQPNVPAPSSLALKDAAGAGYDRVRDMGVDYASDAVAQMALRTKAALEKEGFLAEVAPGTHALIDKLTNPPANSVASITGLDAARKSARKVAGDFTKPHEQAAASEFIKQLDNFIEAADPRAVVAGPAAVAGKELATARGNYAAGARSDRIHGIEERADLKAAAANSGRNLDNTIRQRVADVVIDPKKSAGFSPQELAALEGVVFGTPVRNRLRDASNMLGGGGGLGAMVAGLGTGAATGSATNAAMGAGIGALVPAAGMAARGAQNYLGRRALNAVDDLTRQRSPLYEDMLSAASPQVREMMREQALLGAGVLSALRKRDEDKAVGKSLLQLLREGGA